MNEWKLVPCEANEEMTAAGRKAWDNNLNADEFLARAYQLMLAAAPAPDGAITNEGTKVNVQPVVWLYDFPNPDDSSELVKNWTAYSMDEVRRNSGVNVRPLYLHPPAADVQELVECCKRLLTFGKWINDEQMVSHCAELMDLKAALAKWEGK